MLKELGSGSGKDMTWQNHHNTNRESLDHPTDSEEVAGRAAASWRLGKGSGRQGGGWLVEPPSPHELGASVDGAGSGDAKARP